MFLSNEMVAFAQVFHSLLKAHAVEARSVVRQALDILTPYMPARMEDDNVRATVFSVCLSVCLFVVSTRNTARTWYIKHYKS